MEAKAYLRNIRIAPRKVQIVLDLIRGKDLKKAQAVMGAYEEAMAKGSGVVALNGKMIDKPVVIRAQRLLELNELAGVREVEEI